jgi:hypothetical protein
MPAGSSRKRERQYEHIKEGAQKRGTSTKRAKEIAARTVNKERARSGESRTASKTSTEDMSSARRGGKRPRPLPGRVELGRRGIDSPTLSLPCSLISSRTATAAELRSGSRTNSMTHEASEGAGVVTDGG